MGKCWRTWIPFLYFESNIASWQMVAIDRRGMHFVRAKDKQLKDINFKIKQLGWSIYKKRKSGKINNLYIPLFIEIMYMVLHLDKNNNISTIIQSIMFMYFTIANIFLIYIGGNTRIQTLTPQRSNIQSPYHFIDIILRT